MLLHMISYMQMYKISMSVLLNMHSIKTHALQVTGSAAGEDKVEP
jgi:hypothetical protein